MKKNVIAFVVGLIRYNDKYLLTKRIELDVEDPKNFKGKWQIPGGGIDYGETAEEAVLREIKEELGIKIKVIRIVPYLINAIRKTWQGVGIVFLCKPAETKFKIKLDGESSAYGWFTYEEIMKLDVLPGGKEAVKAVSNRIYAMAYKILI